MKKTILITGATGFIGKHLLEEEFLQNYHVKLMTRSKESLLASSYPNFEIVLADLNHKEQMIEACKSVDIIVNMAAEVRNNAKLAQTNIEGSKNIVEAMIMNKVTHLIHLSSVGVVGAQFSAVKKTVDEQSSCIPKNDYESTKLASEKIFIEAQQKHQFLLDIIRPTNVYGENHPLQAMLKMLKHVNQGRLLLYTSVSSVNFIYVKDLTQCIGKFIVTPQNKGVFNIGSSMHLLECYKLIQKLTQSKNNYLRLPVVLIKFLDLLNIKLLNPVSNGVVYDDSKLSHFFSYPYGTHMGLKRTIDNYKQKKLLL